MFTVPLITDADPPRDVWRRRPVDAEYLAWVRRQAPFMMGGTIMLNLLNYIDRLSKQAADGEFGGGDGI